ncbi:MAG: hypothetical protein LBP98_06075 [Tannerella sp.]|nr:hypothetical protein [Tannerella sp.]
MQTTVFILWRICSLWTAVIRNAEKAVARTAAVRREHAAGKTGRPAAPAGCRCPDAGRRLPFLKYAPYTARDGIRL